MKDLKLRADGFKIVIPNYSILKYSITQSFFSKTRVTRGTQIHSKVHVCLSLSVSLRSLSALSNSFSDFNLKKS
jgi:hypothetical protein